MSEQELKQMFDRLVPDPQRAEELLCQLLSSFLENSEREQTERTLFHN